MNCTSDGMPTELLIARAFIKLSSIPPEAPEAMVSLASVGNCEIRMFLMWPADLDSGTLFWLELFDHCTRSAVDSFRCLTIKDAPPAFEDFMAQAAGLNNAGPGGAEAH